MTKTGTSSTQSIGLIGFVALAAILLLYFLFWRGGSGNTLPNSVHVAGKVTFNGQPIKLGLIVFEPDPSQGGSGAQGFASIQDGEFNTRKSGGQSVSIGPCIVRVTGGDGVGIDAFTPFGNMMFEEFTTKMVIESNNDPLSIAVPASQGFKAAEFR